VSLVVILLPNDKTTRWPHDDDGQTSLTALAVLAARAVIIP
jgi:hypothetical protein